MAVTQHSNGGGGYQIAEDPRKKAFEDKNQKFINNRTGSEEEVFEHKPYGYTYEDLRKELYGGLDLEYTQSPNDEGTSNNNDSYEQKMMRRYSATQEKVEQDQKEELIDTAVKIGAIIAIGYVALNYL